jgi:hypothetical protein
VALAAGGGRRVGRDLRNPRRRGRGGDRPARALAGLRRGRRAGDIGQTGRTRSACSTRAAAARCTPCRSIQGGRHRRGVAVVLRLQVRPPHGGRVRALPAERRSASSWRTRCCSRCGRSSPASRSASCPTSRTSSPRRASSSTTSSSSCSGATRTPPARSRSSPAGRGRRRAVAVLALREAKFSPPSGSGSRRRTAPPAR